MYPSPGRVLLLLTATAAACVPDRWLTLAPQDAPAEGGPADSGHEGPGDAADDAAEAGAEGTPPCPAGQMRCDGVCVAGPTALYQGEDSADDETGALHALGSTAGYARGRFGQAFMFEGDRDPRYVALPARVADLGTGDFALSLWFLSAYTAGNQTVLARRSACWNGAPFTGLDIRLAFNGRLYIELWSSMGQYVLTSPTGLNDGLWHHLAIVRNGAVARLHVDGAETSSTALPGSMDDPSRTPVYLGVGRCVGGAPGSNGTHDDTHWFTGRIDAVAYFARALSAAELAAAALGRCAR